MPWVPLESEYTIVPEEKLASVELLIVEIAELLVLIFVELVLMLDSTSISYLKLKYHLYLHRLV